MKCYALKSKTQCTRIFVENYGLEEGQVSTKGPKLLPN